MIRICELGASFSNSSETDSHCWMQILNDFSSMIILSIGSSLSISLCVSVLKTAFALVSSYLIKLTSLVMICRVNGVHDRDPKMNIEYFFVSDVNGYISMSLKISEICHRNAMTKILTNSKIKTNNNQLIKTMSLSLSLPPVN